MQIKVAQIVGLNTDQKAAQVLFQQREEDSFLAVLGLTCDDAFTKGRLALSDFADYYFDCEGSPAEKLNATFAQAKEKFSKEGEFNLVLSSVSGKVLYLIGQGEVEIYLKRLDKLSSLLALGEPAHIISGFLQSGDRILLSTKSLITFLGDDFDRSFSLPIDSFEEEISSKIGVKPLEGDTEEETPQELGGEQTLAGLVLDVTQEDEEPITSLEEEEETGPILSEDSALGSKSISILFRVLGFIRKFGGYFPKSGRSRLILALGLVVVIAVGVGLQYKNIQDRERQVQFNQSLQSAKDEFSAAKGLQTLNPAEAKGKLDSALEKINHALSLYPKNQEAKDLRSEIESESSSILKQFEAKEFQQFLDLNLIKKDFKAQNLSFSAGKILLLDPDTKTLVSIDLEKKGQQILAGRSDLGDAKYAAINGSLAFVYSEDKGIIKVEGQKTQEVAEKDSQWERITDIAGFAGNVYLLDSRDPSTSSGQVWKYIPTTEGYSSKREYLTESSKADFTNAIRMQIESSIYVLKQGGEILRFTRGAEDHFSLGGLDKGIKDPKSFYTSSDTEDLYILDSGNSRLLILTKTGEYKGQITGDKFGTASDLVVDEEGKKVYLLEGSKIYSVDLK